MSVAIRAITRLQEADDVNVTLGAGVDEYALTWDNDTARFVLRAPIAGLLATGATTGATAQAQAFTNGIIGPSWKPSADSTTALQMQNGAGTSVLNVDTTNARVGIGTTAPSAALQINGHVIVYSNGAEKIIYTGSSAGSTGMAASASTSFEATNGPCFGMRGNTYTALATQRGNIFFVAGSPSTPVAGESEIRFFTGAGLRAMTINKDQKVGIGIAAPSTLLHALLTSAATNAVSDVLTIGHDTSGTAANGFGAGQLFALESSTTAAQSAARIQVLWNDATHATRKADLVLTAYDSGGEREGLRIRADGSEPALGFYGVSPIARAVLATGVGATVDNVIAALQNLGLVKQS